MAILPSYKDIVDLLKKGSTLEAQEKIMELRAAALELQEENLALRDKLKTAEATLQLRAKVQWERPYYWLVEGDHRDGPFCQLCYDKSAQLIRLQGGANGKWRCTSCGVVFLDKTYKAPLPSARPQGDWLER